MAFFNVGGSSGGSTIDVSELVKQADFESWGDNVTGGRKSPDGYITQWGRTVAKATGFVNINFPKAFPAVCFQVICTITGSHAHRVVPHTHIMSASTFQLLVRGDEDQYVGANVIYTAIGR